MKLVAITCVLLLICALLFFLAPHHRRDASLFKPSTLFGIYRDLFSEFTSIPPQRVGLFMAFAIAGIFASFYPAILPAMLRHNQRGAILVLWAVVVLVGAVVNFLAMLVSHMTIGFGVSQSHDETPFIFAIPIFQALFAVASLVFGFSSSAANWATRALD